MTVEEFKQQIDFRVAELAKLRDELASHESPTPQQAAKLVSVEEWLRKWRLLDAWTGSFLSPGTSKVSGCLNILQEIDRDQAKDGWLAARAYVYAMIRTYAC